MEADAQKVEALKRGAKYRRHLMKKKKHERNAAQARQHEAHRSQYRKRPDFDSHRGYAPQAKLHKVTSGRLSVPRGLFLKGRASSILKKTGDGYLNALNYARKKEELGQIIQIGTDQAKKIGSQVHPKRKTCSNDPVKRLPEENKRMTDGTGISQEEKRKNIDRIKSVLGIADPGPSFVASPTAGAEDTNFVASSIPTPARLRVQTEARVESESPKENRHALDPSQEVPPPDRDPLHTSCNMLDDEEKDEMDDLFLEKLVSDIGLYAWNSQKPSSEPYENCDEKLIKDIISLRDVALNEMAKYNKANKAKQPHKTSETITSLPPGLPQSEQKSADFKVATCHDVAQSNWASFKRTGLNTTKGKVQKRTSTTQSHSVDHDMIGDCYRDLLMKKEAGTYTGRTEDTDDDPARMPLPADRSFVSPSTPPISVHAFDPKAFMQDVEVQRKPQVELRYPPTKGCSTGGGCVNSRQLDVSEDEYNADDYDTALSQCYDVGASGKSDGSDVSCNLYKYRRAMY